MTTRAKLQELGLTELRDMAGKVDVDHGGLQKSKLITAILGSEKFDASMVPDPDEATTNGDAAASTEDSASTKSAKNSGNGDDTSGKSTSKQDSSSSSSSSKGSSSSKDSSSGGRNDSSNKGGSGQSNRDNRNRDGRDNNRDRNNNDDDRQGGSNRRRRRRNRGGGQDQQIDEADLEVREGILDILPEGYGFLRCTGYLPGDKDVYVAANQVRKGRLRKGDICVGPVRPARAQEKFPALVRVQSVNGIDPDKSNQRPKFSDLTPLFPDERLRLEVDGQSTHILPRIVDIIAPIGKGQRGLIVSPPKAGKTTVLKEIAASISANNPECYLMVVLVDERPEEVTDMQRSVKGEVIYSTFDRPAEEHTQVSELAIERAKRLVESGTDVVILLDSITRLARAHNLATPASGRILSGGVDSTALYPPKRFFGAARNIEEGGSLTILGTALVETGSRMDEVIFEEFKGTGNMELRLDRKLADKRIYPAIDIESSGTRREELLFHKDELHEVWKLRRVLLALESGPALELLIDRLKSTKSNAEFLATIAKSGQ